MAWFHDDGVDLAFEDEELSVILLSCLRNAKEIKPLVILDFLNLRYN